MAISFSCGQCGNDYVVSDGLAGKSAICKACGARMTVPASDGAAETEASTEPTEVAPIEGPTPASASAVRPTVPPRPMPVTKPAGGSGKFIRVALVLAALGFGLYSRMNRASKADVRAFLQQQAAILERINGTLKTVKDVPSARAASGPINQAFRELHDLEAKNRNKKAPKADIEAAKAEFGPRQEALQKESLEEMVRLAAIPGAMQALDLKNIPGNTGDEGADKDSDKP